MQPATMNLWKSLNQDINHMKKKIDPPNNHKINFGPTKYPRGKNSDPRIPTRKNWIHEMPTRKKFGPTNTHQKILDPLIIQEKKFRTQQYPREKFWTHKIPTRKNFRPTKDSREKILDPRNAHEGTMAPWQ